MARLRRSRAEYDRLQKEKSKLLRAIEYADDMHGHKDNSLWQTMSRLLEGKIKEYGDVKHELIDHKPKDMTPEQFLIEVTIARRSEKICQSLLNMPQETIKYRQVAKSRLEKLEKDLEVQPGQILPGSSASSSPEN